MERSDEARREDSLYNRIGSLERTNRQQAEKITELERIIVEAKECVRITQEMIGRLRSEADKQHEAFHKAIEPVARWYNRDTILATVIDIVADLQKDRKAVLAQTEHNRRTKEQLTVIKTKLMKFQINNDNTLEQILDDLKLVKLYHC